MKALYRKYRPTKLADVVGQDQVKKPLENALKSGRISHAYLFTGPRGCGKTSVARIFAHAINKFDYEIEDSYVDIIEIDAASSTGVDNIRELREKAMISPTKGKYKVYIIDEVHMLSKSAFNALLKTLEEPPKSVVFIMATTDAHKVPDTISSRAQVYTFNLAEPDIIKKHLKNIAKKEKIKIDDDALDVIIARGGGSFRDSISLLDQISTISQNQITREMVLDTLGLPDSDAVQGLLSAYEDGDMSKITDLLHQELDANKNPEILAESLISAIIKNPEPKLLPLLERLPSVKAPYPEAKILLAFLAEAAEKPVLRIVDPNPTPVAAIKDSAPKARETSQKPASSAEPKDSTPSAEPKDSTPIAPQVEQASKMTPSDFSWENYVKQVYNKNSAVGGFLQKSIMERQGEKIIVYIEKRVHRNIINSKNNRQILDQLLPEGMTIEIHDAAEHLAKNQKLSKISDIMGTVTEVKTDGDPFE